ncbi:MAG: flagellar export chaperone FliS [Aeromonadaceae bacterium]
MYHKNLKAYTANNLQADMSVADPHRVIQLMMQGTLEKLAQAKGAIDRRDYEAKSAAISRAMALINGLQDSLDLSYGKIPEDLLALYEYMKGRLMDASRDMDKAPLDEVANLLITIKSAWDQIPDTEKQKSELLREQQRAKASPHE